MIEHFLREELAGKYEVLWRYEFRTNSIVIEMRDGLLRENRIVAMGEICPTSQANFEFMMVQILRGMMHEIDAYRAKEKERLKGSSDIIWGDDQYAGYVRG